MKKKGVQLDLDFGTLQQAEEKLERMRVQVASERLALLERLHEKLGYKSISDLIDALWAIDHPGQRRRGGHIQGTDRDKRRKIAEEKRKLIVAALKSGITKAEVSAQFGISMPSVHRIKESAGLVKKRRR